MRPCRTVFRLLYALLTVWCPGCATVGPDESAAGPIEVRTLLRSESPPRQYQLELTGCLTEQSDSCCEWPCLTCCRYLPMASFQIQAEPVTTAAPGLLLVMSRTLPDTPPLVRPPILS